MTYLGVDYYPEHWPKEMVTEDIQGIKEMGANIVRIGEFAWHLMEKKDGQFNFSYFDMVIDSLKEKGLDVMFGTPTATFPAWLADRDPSILSEDEYGHKRVFGGRRQYCFHSDTYREHSARITKELVKHYQHEQAIVVWQVDNEFGHEGSDQCYCDQCHAKFHEFLAEKYHDIYSLNERWGTVFWGQTYNDFTEIPVPKPTITTHNPGLKLDWARFRSASLNRFAHDMTNIVKQYKGTHQRVTTNVAGGFFNKWFDHAENLRPMDFVSYDNYPVWGGLEEPIPPAEIAMTLDFNRGLLDKNFWIVEELMGAQGHDVIGYLPRPNQAKMWSYQAFAHGCNHMLYFRWRGMTKGAEQFCYGVIDQDNQYGRKYKEVQSLFHEISSYEDVLESPIKSEIAVIYDYDNIWSWRAQSQSKDFDFKEELMRLYRPFYSLNTHIDVIPCDRDLSTYKVVLVPVMQIIDQRLADQLAAFAEKGGTVVFSFRAGLKNKDNNIHFKQPLPGPVRSLTGIKIEEVESLTKERTVPVEGTGDYNGETSRVAVWRDLIVAETAEVLFRYQDGLYGQYAAVTRNTYGKGNVYYIGGGLGEQTMDGVAMEIIGSNDLSFVESDEDVEVYRRHTVEETFTFIMNHSDQMKSFQEISLQPFESRIIKH
ncbi:beta-galactosidase [Halobacillus shinanisalinarum]|uniref:Beta-galactosidase n=1 Tax=Halobacillus shinanisalinarum TaxID=2932258 RepID=A0ABY4H310_9BACI|nr:beta-galactosidase [Halobacillus shinanisalinarum]UOQ94842.1 beta-galactosidase [Halobacillus shinanisalinarum]